MSRFLIQRCISLAIAMAAHSAVAGGNQDQGFLQMHCLNCHSKNKNKTALQLDQLRLPVNDENHELWTEVVQNIQRGDMPPKDAEQPSDMQRQAFLAEIMPEIERHYAESSAQSDPLLRLTNNQIAHSLQDLLKTHEHIADQLIGDPVDKHGYSLQARLDLSGSYLQLYANAVEQVVERAIPNIEMARPDIFRIAGNGWENATGRAITISTSGIGGCTKVHSGLAMILKSRYHPSTSTECSCVRTAARADFESG